MANWSTRLRAELPKRAETYATQTGAPGYLSLGSMPTRLFEAFASGSRHGNFLDASYQAICANPSWNARTGKRHPQLNAIPEAKRQTARELDSCNSSDALLMNCFCYPGVADRLMSEFLPSLPSGTPEFGVPGDVALVGGARDATEIDMRIGSAIFEAKLTESDFTVRPKSHVERYARLREVFDVSVLPQTRDEYCGYQLIRNVLAADEHGWSFYVICDARRPDLLREWWAVHSAVQHAAVRTRCGFVLWQEIARTCPTSLAHFLREKYGLGNEAS